MKNGTLSGLLRTGGDVKMAAANDANNGPHDGGTTTWAGGGGVDGALRPPLVAGRLTAKPVGPFGGGGGCVAGGGVANVLPVGLLRNSLTASSTTASASMPMYAPRKFPTVQGPVTTAPITSVAAVHKKREQLCALLADEASEFVANPASRQVGLCIIRDLFRSGENTVLTQVIKATADCGCPSLPVLADVLALVKELRGGVPPEVYRQSINHVCFSSDPEYAPQALDLMLQHRFSPRPTEFVVADSLEYFVRHQHFLSMELAEEVSSQLRRLAEGFRAIHCEIYPSAASGSSYGKVQDGTCFEIRPLQAWQIPRDRFQEEGPNRSGNPVRGDIVYLAVFGRACIGVVVETCRGPDLSPMPVTVVVEQAERLRTLIGETGPAVAYASVGGSKVAFDRMRSAVFEISKRSCSVPAMQQWLILRSPTRDFSHADFADVPKDGQARLWVKFPMPYGRSRVDALGAEWIDQVLPGNRIGPLVFFPDNPCGAVDFTSDMCSGCLVMVVGSCDDGGFAEKARNVASAGAVGLVVWDCGEAPQLVPLRRDDRPFAVDLPSGKPAGFRVQVDEDARVSVTEVLFESESAAAVAGVSEGFFVEDIMGAGILTPEGIKELLGDGEQPLTNQVRIVFRSNQTAPAIPTVVVQREVGDVLMQTIQEAALRDEPLVAELYVSEVATDEAQKEPSPEEDAEFNRSQAEAIWAALSPTSKARAGGHVGLIQGPPGTGKTTCALQIISAWMAGATSQADSKVLVTGFSNIAIDNIGLGLQRAGVGPILRVGRGHTTMTTDTLDDQLHRHHAFGELSRLREAAQSSRASTLGIAASDRQPGRGYGNGWTGAVGEAKKLEKKMTQELMAQARVVLATCITAGGDVLAGSRFRQVLFDEATQATEPASIVPLLKGCQELVLLGDQQQLPPTVLSYRARMLGLSESLFERLIRLGVPHKMLRTQYRMHPAISAFPAHTFYAGLLTNGVRAEDRPAPRGYNWPDPFRPLCFEGIGGPGELLEETIGTSKQNRREATRVVEVVNRLIKGGDVLRQEVAVITPYAAQVALLKHHICDGVSVASVDSFQGMERDVVVVSTVRSSRGGGVGFLSDRRRFNVLLTRARRGLIVFGHQETLLSEPCWRYWVEHCGTERLVRGKVEVMTHEHLREPPPAMPDQVVQCGVDSGPRRWMNFASDLWPSTAQANGVWPPAVRAAAPGVAPSVDGTLAPGVYGMHVAQQLPAGQQSQPKPIGLLSVGPVPGSGVGSCSGVGGMPPRIAAVSPKATAATGGIVATTGNPMTHAKGSGGTTEPSGTARTSNVLPTGPVSQASGRRDRVTRALLGKTTQILMANEFTGFAGLGRVPVEYQVDEATGRTTAMIAVLLPERGGMSVAKATATNQREAEAGCCWRACYLLASAGQLDPAGLECVASLVAELKEIWKTDGLGDAIEMDKDEEDRQTDQKEMREKQVEVKNKKVRTMEEKEEEKARKGEDKSDGQQKPVRDGVGLETPRPSEAPMIGPAGPPPDFQTKLAEETGKNGQISEEIVDPRTALLESGLWVCAVNPEDEASLPVDFGEAGTEDRPLFSATLVLPAEAGTGPGGWPLTTRAEASSKEEAERRVCDKAYEMLKPVLLVRAAKRQRT
eukprot:TRINITY_DN43394_c0_g1_i1.p1 TRINITY_DN43394_c0_g1~~TRINITY_DN43394_c0_g1_i1.p1  ORF type:complete len:1620 (-),score=288.12 TRINITY_DN43394_c0_g1_i1:47-4906(-)